MKEIKILLDNFISCTEKIAITVDLNELVEKIKYYIQVPYTLIEEASLATNSSYIVTKDNKSNIFVYQVPPMDIFSQTSEPWLDSSKIVNSKLGQKLDIQTHGEKNHLTIVAILNGKYLLDKKERLIKKIEITDLSALPKAAEADLLNSLTFPKGKELFNSFVKYVDSIQPIEFTKEELEKKIDEVIITSNFRRPESGEDALEISQKVAFELKDGNTREKFKFTAKQEIKKEIVGKALVTEFKLGSTYTPEVEGEMFFAKREDCFEIKVK